MVNRTVSRARLLAVGPDEDAGCAGRGVLDTRLPAMGLSRLVSGCGWRRRTRFIRASACAAICRLWRESFRRRDARRYIYSRHARRIEPIAF